MTGSRVRKMTMEDNGLMHETYKGYDIWVSWNDDTMGFDFSVQNAKGEKIACSGASYFYDSNALKAAKEVVEKEWNGLGQEQEA